MDQNRTTRYLFNLLKLSLEINPTRQAGAFEEALVIQDELFERWWLPQTKRNVTELFELLKAGGELEDYCWPKQMYPLPSDIESDGAFREFLEIRGFDPLDIPAYLGAPPLAENSDFGLAWWLGMISYEDLLVLLGVANGKAVLKVCEQGDEAEFRRNKSRDG
ncbi:MAG: hypothetical protein KDD68_19280 [Bdellovibrionales bacterium]|nr:hypothetical protein [Bdellovibrionales bacterium]